MKKKYLAMATLLVLLGAGCLSPASSDDDLVSTATDQVQNDQTGLAFPGVLADDEIQDKQARISTAKGDIVIELYADTAPLAVSNFVYLTEQGYYTDLTFHRRDEGFVIQGGDPAGDGSGGPGYTFADELDDDREYSRGIVAMANRGPDTNGSQFFIMLDDFQLPKQYTIFGEVISGMEVVDQIAIGDAMLKVAIETSEN